MSTATLVYEQVAKKYKKTIKIELIRLYLQIYKQLILEGKTTYFPPLKSSKSELQYNQSLVTNILWRMGVKATPDALNSVHMVLDSLQILALSGKVPFADYSPKAAKKIVEAQKKANPNILDKAGAVISKTVGDAVGENPLQKVDNITRNVAIIAAVGAGVYLLITLKKVV